MTGLSHSLHEQSITPSTDKAEKGIALKATDGYRLGPRSSQAAVLTRSLSRKKMLLNAIYTKLIWCTTHNTHVPCIVHISNSVHVYDRSAPLKNIALLWMMHDNIHAKWYFLTSWIISTSHKLYRKCVQGSYGHVSPLDFLFFLTLGCYTTITVLFHMQ